MRFPALPAVILAFTLVVGGGMAAAETSGDHSGPGFAAGKHALTPPPSDSELKKFVTAFVRLISVQHSYMMMMQGEDDPVRLAEMKRHAVEDMTAAVQKDGMTVDRYNAIATALEDDHKLQKRVEGILRRMANHPDQRDEGR